MSNNSDFRAFLGGVLHPRVYSANRAKQLAGMLEQNAMSPVSIWTAFVAAIVLIAAIVGAIVVVFKFTDSAFVLGVLPIAAAIIVAAIQYRAAKDKETDARLFSQKQAAYTELIAVIMGLFHEKKTNPTPDEQTALVKKLQSIRTQLVIWGSSSTLLTLDKMGLITPDTSGLPIEGMKWMAELFAAIRKDLGHKDPHGAALEMALGMLNEPDRSLLRAAIRKAGG